MKELEVSIVNGFINLLYGWVLFWIFLFLLKDIKKLRQIGSIPIPSYFIPVFIYGIVNAELGYSNQGLVVILVLYGLFLSAVAWEFRSEYLKIVKAADKEQWREIWKGNRRQEENNVPLLQVVGYTADTVFFILLAGVGMLVCTGLGVMNILNGSIGIGILFFVFTLFCSLIMQNLENNMELTGRAYEEAVHRHYKNAGFVKKIFKPIKLMDKF